MKVARVGARQVQIAAMLLFACGTAGATTNSLRMAEGPSAGVQPSLSVGVRGIRDQVNPSSATLPLSGIRSGLDKLAPSLPNASTAASTSGAQDDPNSLSIRFTDPDAPRGSQLSPAGGGLQIQGLTGTNVPWSIVIMLTLLTLIPAILMCVTPFARLLIVFHFLRQALGLQTTPSNPTLIGLSLILTFFIMHPVAMEIYQDAIIPVQAGRMTPMQAVKVGEAPLRKFMAHYVRDKDVALFVDLAKEPRPASVNDLSMHVLLPAYILSELKAGFQIGTVLFLPFLIVDMVVASITTSVGMLQLPPVVISTPLKLLLFLMVDGWHLLIGSLIRSFN